MEAYEDVLAFQLATLDELWPRFTEHGVTEASRLRLEFSYDARSRADAERLVAFLEQETDYELAILAPEGAAGDALPWTVDGATQPTEVSHDVLRQWIEWMVAAGFDHGPCAFDGFGATMP